MFRDANQFRLERTKMFKEARKQFISHDLGEPATNVRTLCENFKVFTYRINNDCFTVFGVENASQSNLDYDKVRRLIAAELGQPHATEFNQLIGDSNYFSPTGTTAGAQIVAQMMEETNGFMLYGYTGKNIMLDDIAHRDTNQLLSDWVDAESPARERSARVIGNIVDEHTNLAIEKWGCSISRNVRNFYLVYSNTPEPSVKFGDDTVSSDSITNNRVYLFEGGVQSLRQMIFMISRDIAIQAFTGFRDLTDRTNHRYFNQDENNLPFLSATEFFIHILQMIKTSNSRTTATQLEQFKDIYLDSHAAYNPQKEDAETKQALWDKAWHEMLNMDLSKINLFQSESANNYLLRRRTYK